MKFVLSANSVDEAAAAWSWCSAVATPGDEVIAVAGIDPAGEMLMSFSPMMEVADALEDAELLTGR